jgi:CheY-like chemotaxis protein/predicted RNA-binding Zn-ribbon protein involved in translation (DUF1610 family)
LRGIQKIKKENMMESKRFRILYVEDTKSDQIILEQLLEKKCEIYFELTTVETGTEGLKKLDEEEFDLIILDYRLPGMTGLEFLEELRIRPINTPVIFVTSKGDEKVAVDAMKSGVRDYIVKDEIDLDRIVKNINEIVLESNFPKELDPKIVGYITKLFSASSTINLEIIENQKTKMGINQSLDELVFELNKLVESKILKAEPLCSTVACPFCDSLKTKLHLQCPECYNVQLIKGEALEHMNCGNIDLRFKFDKGNGEKVCPKCGKKINQIDVDYRKVGSLYKCSNGHLFSLPDINLKCSECGKIFNLDEAILKILYQYKLIETGQNRIRIGSLKDNILEENKKPEHKNNITLNIAEIAKRLLQ